MNTRIRGTAAAGMIGVLLVCSVSTAAHADVDAPQAPATEAPAEVFSLGDAADLGDGLVDIAEPELDALLAAVNDAANVPIVVESESHPALGIAENPEPEQDAPLYDLIEPVLSAHPEITFQSVDLLATDTDAVLEIGENNGSAVDDEQSRLLTRLRSVDPKQLEAFLKSFTGSSASQIPLTPAQRRQEAQNAYLKSMMDHMRQVESAINEEKKRAREREQITALTKLLFDGKTTVVGSMRSTPVALGSATWDQGEVAGAFDLSQVPDGAHHLILDFADTGVTMVASVTVAQAPDSAPTATTAWAWGLGGAALVAVAVIGGLALRRRGNRNPRS